MGSFLYLPVSALICYIFLFGAFISSRENKIIKSFLLIIESGILWVAGSLLMRAQFWPSIDFWYHVSLFGIICTPYVILNFILYFVGEKKTRYIKGLGYAMPLLFVVNIFTNKILAPPKMIYQVGNTPTFIYEPTIWVALFFIPAILTIFQITKIIVKSYKNDIVTKSQFSPIVCGLLIVVLGNLLIMFPQFEGIPLDIFAGIVNAFFIFYALYKKRLFKLSLLFSQASCYVLASVCTLLLFINFMSPLGSFIDLNLNSSTEHDVILIIILFMVSMGVIYILIKKLLDSIFVREEVKQAERIKNFSLSVSKSLKANEILDELIDVIKASIHVKKVYVLIPDLQGQSFSVVKSGSPLDKNAFKLRFDNPIIEWLKHNDEVLILKEFKRTVTYRSMWESEKDNIRDFGIECIAPLKNEDELVGVVAVCGKEDRKGSFTFDDINFLSSINSVASIGVKNSRLYEKACNEARTDELTGLLNRKYFHEVLQEQYEKYKDKSLSLVILSIDDFKLYNQLYGNLEGDIALKRIAQIIQASVNEHAYIARYSGKEFAIILPMCDVMAAKNLAENIRTQIFNINKNAKDYSMKVLTVSGGICSIPYGASNIKQLLDNVDMAIYHVKRKGKNAIMVYSEGIIESKAGVQNTPKHKETIYSEYASTIYALTATIDTKDHYTFTHSKNVAYYATELAYAYGLNDDSVEIIREAALLHDIGKIGIPEDILNKPGKLTDEEYEIMKEHVENSIGIIRHLPSLDYVIPAVIGHHERYDGRGYPRRISGEDIPISARILCIADSFDAIISKRSYKNALSVERALEIIEQEMAKQFDPKLALLFIDLIKSGKIKPQIEES